MIGQNGHDDSESDGGSVLVMGDDRFGLAVAESLSENGRSVTFVSERRPSDVTEDVDSLSRSLADANDVGAIRSDVSDVDLVVVVGSDSRTLLLGHLARSELGANNVVAGVSDPSNGPAFDATDIDHIDVSALLAERIGERYG